MASLKFTGIYPNIAAFPAILHLLGNTMQSVGIDGATQLPARVSRHNMQVKRRSNVKRRDVSAISLQFIVEKYSHDSPSLHIV